MEEYYFLFFIGFIWTLFAVIQDFKSREVANWLNFSLIAGALAYRGFYSFIQGNWNFFIYGLIGVLLFFLIALIFYYGRAFGGGDAKLLMGYGAILPFESIFDLVYKSGEFIFILFFAGMIWTLAYSGFLIEKRKKEFTMEFKGILRKNRYLLWIFLLISALLLVGSIAFQSFSGLLAGLVAFLLVIPVLFVYLKAVEKSCMIFLRKPEELREGDWLAKDVRIENKVIRKSVHGLDAREIIAIRKSGKKVWVKEGVPFTISFLFALVMEFFFLFLQLPDFWAFLS